MMPTLTEQIQTNIRAVTGTAGQWVEDWHALFNLAAIPVGQFDERLIAYYRSFNVVQDGLTSSAALNYFLLNPGTSTAGMILALFAAGEQGAWYDPSDFATLFQDSAGTIPVTAIGQPVGRMLDKSGRSNHVIQAVAASRPVLQQDGTGRYYLACDGVDDFMSTTSAVNFSVTDKSTACTGIRKGSDAARGMLFELGNAAASGGIHIEAPNSAAANYQYFSQGTVTQVAVAAPFAAPITNVVTGIGDISGDLVQIRVNGNVSATTSADQGTGNYRNDTVFMFRRGGTQFPFNGNFYGLVIRGAASNAAQISQLEAYMNSKTGAF